MELAHTHSYQIVYNNIIRNFKNYFLNSKLESMVIGVSGGIDSALVSALAYKAIEEMKKEGKNIKLIGQYLPILTNSTMEEYNAKLIMNAYMDECIVNMKPQQVFKSCYQLDEDLENQLDMKTKIRQGNIKARLRMIELYDCASKNNGLVLSTDNLTEYYLGFWTLHGDVGDYSPIQFLWKTEVYGLSHYIADYILNKDFDKSESLKCCIDAIPTDGLGITNSDLDQIKAESYFEVDDIIISHLNGEACNFNHPVMQRMINSQFKRHNPYSISREELLTLVN